MTRITIENTENRYGAVGLLFHWSMGILIMALAGLGLYMVTLPDAGFNLKKITLILYHKDFGMLVLVLAVLRLAWRLNNVVPQAAKELPDWQQIAARFVHLTFYALMFALPITGWLMSSAAGFPVSLLELFTFPDLVSHNDYLFQRFVEIHKWLGYGFIFFILVHAGAALGHHFIFKDDTLRKMLP
jgi:cytochrome b561